MQEINRVPRQSPGVGGGRGVGAHLTELILLQIVCLRQLQTGFGLGGKTLSKTLLLG